ncbi:uncharacterized protein LOC106156686 [Lingula anatina]|uniref:Uncharacterized protein LOC106156686 n=1 Tax=Lingula anatina TaxID=7574 RepID=A0A1S3HN98_LINAN|nr:uncharacterized protein LOC106156686 [Lingula anatina]|eukprot:XP_013387512.1 uncharacterized protein LOC106156686 [Lingula anatina]
MQFQAIAGVFSRCLVITLSFATVIPFGRVISQLGDNCILFARPELLSANGSAIVGLEKTKWGSMSWCEYCTYAIIFDIIVSVISCWFIFVFFRRGDYNRHKVCLTVPMLILEVCLFGFSLAAAVVREVGFRAWCNTLQTELGWAHCNEHSVVLESNPKREKIIFVPMHISVICNWCLCVVVFFQLIATVVACVQVNKVPDSKQLNNNGTSLLPDSKTKPPMRHVKQGEERQVEQNEPHFSKTTSAAEADRTY